MKALNDDHFHDLLTYKLLTGTNMRVIVPWEEIDATGLCVANKSPFLWGSMGAAQKGTREVDGGVYQMTNAQPL